MKNEPVNAKRRGFLLAAGVGSATAVGTVALTNVPAAQKVVKSAPVNVAGYRDSEHVRDYYDSARI